MGLIRCDECHDWHDMDKPCPPAFEVYYEDCTEIIHAHDHENAALKFAEHYNSNGDYALMNESIDVKVVDAAGVAKFFKVVAEPYINYTSTEIEGDENGNQN